MLSNVPIPLLDPHHPAQVCAYESALNRLSDEFGVVVPGHGAVVEGPEVATHLAADRACIRRTAARGGIKMAKKP